ncbi:MAG: Trk family potassium uptake protein [Clostridia bacterium]|nr:Trk family potassium uptake protein [Clostridia bacterium]
MEKAKDKKRFRLTTFQIIVTGFAALILAGTLLLMLPFSSTEPGCAPFSDCLFTATSAVCVTGLVVRDTATGWTPFGQAVILILIQTGGMGVVTMAVVLSFLSGRRIGLMQRSVMAESISAPQVGGILKLTRFIVVTSLCIEGLGAVALLLPMIFRFGPVRGIWYALFHSVSAFCNAGFDLMGIREPYSSLTGFAQDPWVNAVIMILITVGGIGFLVWNDFREHGLHFRHYRLQSKIVLLTSAILVVFPALWILLFELPELSVGQRILPALFQSVTLRTAGFNTVSLNLFSDSGQALMIMWMLIGGSPGSTAGGMKTTTVAVLLMTAWAVFRRKDQITCFGRRIGEEAVRHVLAILLMYACLFYTGAVAISHIERLPLLTCMFETASAVGTVGVTLGITSHLGQVSRFILIVLMFLGRVGGLTLIYAAQPIRPSVNSAYPLERVTVG